MLAFAAAAALAVGTLACSDCRSTAVQTRLVRRMQPDAHAAASLPRAPLRWGALNVLHTTDTHGWLEGHLKEPSYGADWGDFVSFAAHMRKKADHLGVDLLLVDSGDLHDGNGLSDATAPNGVLSNLVFENIDYDLLAIGNHELYVSDIAYEHFNRFAKVFGDRYLTSNVRIKTPKGDFEYIGKQYRYFTTKHGAPDTMRRPVSDNSRPSNNGVWRAV
jgi:2',3'-cyclic-nucleotide 2'-phosphodiesterase (5'-nucleotidase family)